jgi:hypothetical protein
VRHRIKGNLKQRREEKTMTLQQIIAEIKALLAKLGVKL